MDVASVGSHRFVTKGLVALLAAALTFTPASTASLLARSSGAVGGLSVASDPPDAAVYLDGRYVGTTPLELGDVAAGDHRVRVVKTGFLENSRVVGVTGGEAKAVDVRLTPYAGNAETSASSAQLTGPGGLLTNKLFLLGVAGGVAGLTVWALNRNSAPVIGSVVASPTIGLAGSTAVTFTAQGARDEDGDPLSFDWDFGDGSTAMDGGATATHTYTTAGQYTATATVSDGKKSASADSGTVTIRDLNGTWNGVLLEVPTVVMLTQSGSTLSGSFSIPGLASGTVSGSVSATSPRVTFAVTIPGFTPFTFTGNPNTDISTLTGTVMGSGFTGETWSMSR